MKKLYKLFLAIFLSVSVLVTPLLSLSVIAEKNDALFYDPRCIYQNQLKPKFQVINGPCWAFASMASLETYLANRNMFDGSLSEKHLLNWVHRGKNKPGWNLSIHKGGVLGVADAYFTAGAGPVLNKEMPYNINDNIFDEKCNDITPKYFVKGIKNVDSDIESIKAAISEYSAVTVGYKINADLSHAVSIIGWNDNLQKWLVKDSGSVLGYSWLPFNTKFSPCQAFTDVERYNSEKKVYQHDECGVMGSITSLPYLCCANVYDFKAGETLDSIMICSGSAGANYNLYYVPTLSDGTPNQNIMTWTKLGSGKIPYAGYSTFDLDNKIQLPQGKGAIALELVSASKTQELNIGYTSSCNNSDIYVEPQSGISYVLSQSECVDVRKVPILQKESVNAFSIKAITIKK